MDAAENQIYGRKWKTTLKYQKHGMYRTPIYSIWINMMRRCYEKDGPVYQNYGGRGILVCERWHTFLNFYADMGEKPPGLSLDRLNNDLGYSKENCEWRTPLQQARNQRSNRRITINGETKALNEWCEIFQQPYSRVAGRIKLGWDEEKALREPRSYPKAPKPVGARKNAKLTVENVLEIKRKLSLGISKKAIAKEYSVSHSNIRAIADGDTWRHIGDDMPAKQLFILG